MRRPHHLVRHQDPALLSFPTELAQAYVFDLDGTIYLGDQLLPGARRLVAELRRQGVPVRFLSNNPTRDPQQYLDKLRGLGVCVHPEEICSTVVTTTRWLREHHPGAKVFAIAEEPLKRALAQAGIVLTEDPEEIDIVVASYDRTFDYRKLQTAFDAIWFYQRAFLIQTNPDPYCPFPGGRGEPDCAAVTAAIEACTGHRCRVSLGKPSPLMVAEALRGLEVEVSQCVMVGDRLATDIQMALDAGMGSACVLTGEATASDIASLEPSRRPRWVLDRVDRLVPAGTWQRLGWSEDE
ncbi:HAD-IIA family hydrolase [Actinomyces sp. 2119]|uniref:HAD-IIA family hydrolase n=1 Tax=Actinomyces lilanjuaniae TaxID=2321394 RepID=A0ABN5PQC6_9ACTO|nr:MULTISPECIES: HAD-IIA family hydrolase [Actinomyces]AYD89254.1 HAD-IIA family hydrolase [Actinomyces lilanjuaniae]RJF40666.1 HAD-IIA family hydrolase [Actinomyces sp. 2119]